MEITENLVYVKSSIDIFIDIIKAFSIIIFTYYTNFKLTNQKVNMSLISIIWMAITSVIYVLIKKQVNYLIGIITLTIAISLIFSTKNIGKTIGATIISLTINHILSIISIIISFLIKKLLNINNDYFHLISIDMLHHTKHSHEMIMFHKIKKLENHSSILKHLEPKLFYLINI